MEKKKRNAYYSVSNGFIYKKAGVFTAAMVGNSSRRKLSDGGVMDDSTARLVMPRFYDKNEEVVVKHVEDYRDA